MNHLLAFPTAPKTKPVFNGLLDEFLNRSIHDFVGFDFAPWHPSANVLETKENFKIQLAAPGFTKENFSVGILNNQLTITGELKTEKAATEGDTATTEPKNERWTRREFQVASFKRSFTLPPSVNQNEILAVYEHGILTLTLPKKEEVKPAAKFIEIA